MTYEEKPAATVEVVAYDGKWAAMFDVERELLAAVFPKPHPIEHIGSTSIPGLAAKPTIDILVVPGPSALRRGSGRWPGKSRSRQPRRRTFYGEFAPDRAGPGCAQRLAADKHAGF